tara:strand:- start:72 stop:185 length:114 start_codon:yes stop_codon:yes gene_type:complete
LSTTLSRPIGLHGGEYGREDGGGEDGGGCTTWSGMSV